MNKTGASQAKPHMAWVSALAEATGWLSARHPVRLHTWRSREGRRRSTTWQYQQQGNGMARHSTRGTPRTGATTSNLPGNLKCQTTGRWPPWLRPICIGNQDETAGEVIPHWPISQGLAKQELHPLKAAGRRHIQAGQSRGSPCRGVAPDEMPQQPLRIPILDLRHTHIVGANE